MLKKKYLLLVVLVALVLFPGTACPAASALSRAGPAPIPGDPARSLQPESLLPNAPDYIGPPAGEHPAMAYDPTRQVSILYLTGVWDASSWEYDGRIWKEIPSPPHMDPGYAMAHDTARQATILGGRQTWEYTGSHWSAMAPFPYTHVEMTYDEARQRTIAFGGMNCDLPYCPVYDGTWEYTGTTWVQISTTQKPPARVGHAIAYDRNRQASILFGGMANGERANDTWAYDGKDWHPLTPVTSPPARSGHTMVYDQARDVIVLFGGYGEGGYLGDTWEYDGETWHAVSFSLDTPPPRTAHAMVYDESRGAVVLFGGSHAGEWLGDTWEYDGSTWRQAALVHRMFLPFVFKGWAVPQQPPASYAAAMSYDAGRQISVLYAGWPTWEYDGTGWQAVPTASVPRLDQGQAIAYDQDRQVTVLAGLRSNYYGETWEYNGSDWERLSNSPLYLYSRMAYDQAHGQTIAFGGQWCAKPGCAYFDRTWAYSATQWSQISTTVAPPARASHAMAYDTGRQAIILFGGIGQNGAFSDTWSFDGQSWHFLTPTISPPERSGHALVYDARRGVLVLFGGTCGGRVLSDTWEYNGASWHQAETPMAPTARAGHGMTFDMVRGVVVLYGGHNNEPGQSYADTWEYDGFNWRLAIP